MFLGTLDWNYIATWRPHYNLTQFSSDKRIQDLISAPEINQVFFALEKDRYPDMNHAHLLLNAKHLNRESLAKALGVNKKQVGYFQPVIDKYKVADYCAKEIGRNIVHYNFFYSDIR